MILYWYLPYLGYDQSSVIEMESHFQSHDLVLINQNQMFLKIGDMINYSITLQVPEFWLETNHDLVPVNPTRICSIMI